MTTNRSWRVHSPGGIEALQLDDLPESVPAAGEVRVAVRAVSLNRADLLWLTGSFFKPSFPAGIGYEVCGIVDALGPGVTNVKLGERVSNVPGPHIGDYPGFFKHALFPATALLRTPSSLSVAEGASFMFVHMTQLCGLIELAQLKPGQVVLITAGSSANGLSAMAVARLIGAEVIATTRRSSQRPALLAAGADHVIVSGEEDMPAEVMRITDGHGADLIYDCVGGSLTNELLRSAAPHAHWIMYGFLDVDSVIVNWTEWFERQIRLDMFSLMQFTGLPQLRLPGRPEQCQRAIRAVLQLVGSGRLAVPIAQKFQGIEFVPDAFRAMQANLGGGKIAIEF